MADARSSMVPYGYQWNSCGYCGSRAAHQQTSPKFYAESECMKPEDYQTLADRGWRRSGNTYYKPDMRSCCCPHYTIRLKADEFRASTNQRSAVNAFNKYVTGIEYRNKAAQLCPLSRQEKRQRRQQRFDVRHEVHKTDYTNLGRPSDPNNKGEQIEPAHKLEVTLESDEFTEEKYQVYKNYQIAVHKDPPSKVTKSGFRGFLCSGFAQTKDAGGKLLGSYHQCYRLDGELVAFGVLDLLPHAVSSVYVVYRDDVAHWKFGKLTALREIALTLDGGYEWYYMGYYIHGCAKMKYKADYRPQYVLDGFTLQWHPVDASFWQALERGKFVAFDDEQRAWTARESKSHLDYKNKRPTTIWASDFPGVPSIDKLIEEFPISKLRCKAQGLHFNAAAYFGEWKKAEIEAGRSLQTIMAELVACVGFDLAERMAIDMQPYWG